MIALLGGLGASVCFAASALCGSRASREIGAPSTLAWVMGIGLVLVAVPTLVTAPFSQLTGTRLVLLGVAGVTNVAGLRIEYVALTRGRVGAVTAIVSTEGVIATVIAVLAGVHLAAGTALVLCFIALGVALAAATPDPVHEHHGGLHSAALAIPVATLFGVNLYAIGHVGSAVSVLWVLLPGRLVGFLVLLLPRAARGTLRLTRHALPLVAGGAVGEALGILSYTLGARRDLPVAAVAASQFAALAALGGFLLFHERLSRLQLAGLVVIALGVGVLAATSA